MKTITHAHALLTALVATGLILGVFAHLAPMSAHAQQVSICEEPGENLLGNPSFEEPQVPDNGFGWAIFENATSGLEWTVDWYESNMSGTPDPENGWLELHEGNIGAITWSSADGAQHAELDSDWDGPTTTPMTGEEASVVISQNISTVPGVEYTLSWEFSPRPGTDEADNVLEVLLDGVATATNSGAGGDNTSWQSDSLTFVATDSITEIAFRDAGTPNSEGTLLDNVSLTCEEQEEQPTHATGTITVQKQVTEGSNLEALFDFSSDFMGDFSLGSTQSTSTVVTTGTYSVSENIPDGWTRDDAVCVYNEDENSTSTPDKIIVTEGDSVVCTFLNDENEGGDEEEELACTLSASKNPVNSGSTFTLNWSSVGADSAQLSGFDSVATSGATSTSINTETTFTLAVASTSLQATSTCDVTVGIDSGGGSSGGGGGEKIELSDDDDDENEEEEEEEDEGPEPEVLGEQVTAVPAVAPATGAGGAAGAGPLSSLVALLGILLSLGTLRATRNDQ